VAHDERRSTRDLVLIGGSSGSLNPVRSILSALPADFPATVLCVQHLESRGRASTEVLRSSVALRTRTAEDKSPLEHGVVYFAPPDRHLVLEGSDVRVVRGPRENNVRPSIDVLFRSAAVSFRSRAIAVLLSGTQSDGVLGIAAVKRCGGITIVQDPKDALSPELPTHALRDSDPDHVCSAEQISELLLRLCRSEAPAAPEVPRDLLVEARAAAAAMGAPDVLSTEIGEPMHVTCPECDGPIWRLKSPGPPDFRCEIGHGFNTESLLAGQSRSLERALWVAFRTLKERGIMINELAKGARERGFESSARSFDGRRAEVEEHAAVIHSVLTAGWDETLEHPSTPPGAKPPPASSKA
jgi:two-component system chemotaxis response regulator CheB